MRYCGTHPGSRGLLLVVTLILVHGTQAQQAFKSPPRNVTVQAGGRAQLKCQVLRQTGVVQWVKDGLLLGPRRDLPAFPRYTITGDKRKGEFHLLIVDITLEDDAPYQCQVGQSSSSPGIISEPAWLTVQVPPKKPSIEFESARPWITGKEYTVTCTAPDAKPAAEITLFKDGIELTDLDPVTLPGSEDKLIDTQVEVRVKAHSTDDGKHLVCKATNPALPAGVEDTKVMAVYFPPPAPVIEGLDSNTPVIARTALKLICLSRGGNPLPSLQWTKDGKLLSQSWEEDASAQISRSRLSLQVTAGDNQAVLQCESINQVSRAPVVVSVTLTVHFEPADVKILGKLEAVEGQAVKLCCQSSSSNPPANIHWWLGNRELGTAVNSSSEGENGGMTTWSNLTHVVSREDNGAQVICEAVIDAMQFSTSRFKTLNVFYSPQRVWLDNAPEGVTLQSGQPLSLLCLASGGNPRAQLTWFKDRKPVQSASKQVAMDRGVSLEHRFILQPSDNLATYRCDATNKANTRGISAQTRLSVQFPPIKVEITVVDQSVLRAGDTVTLLCLCGSSNPKAKISWTVGLNSGLSGEEKPSRRAEYGGVSFHNTLKLTLTARHHQERVTCKAFSELLSEGVSSVYTLNVHYPPKFSAAMPKNVQAREGDVVHLPDRDFIVSANPEVTACDWIFNGKRIAEEEDLKYSVNNFVLKIRNVSRHDVGEYRVECSNEEGQSHFLIHLHISYAPRIKMKVERVHVDLGGTIDLMCEVEANPVISDMFAWKWLGDADIDLEDQHVDNATGWLTLFNVTRAHSGAYQCDVDNGIYPPASARTELVVLFKPQLRKGLQWSKVAIPGDDASSVELTCQAEGNPTVHFHWAKNGVDMDLSGDSKRYSENTVRVGPVHTSTLHIKNVSATLDCAIFTCTASNKLGDDSVDIQLLTASHPEPPLELRLLHVSNSSATLEWEPGFNGGFPQRFRIRYHWKGSISHYYVDVLPPTTTVYTVRGLLPATTYHFSVTAINRMGESGFDRNTSLTVTTNEEESTVYPGPPGDTDLAGALGVWHYVLIIIASVLLMPISCFSFLLLLRWKKHQKDKTGELTTIFKGKSNTEKEGSTSTPSRYTNTELTTASTVETNSTVYESYEEDSCHYYYPTDELPTTVYTGGANRHDHHGHEYEEVANEEIQFSEIFPPVNQFFVPPSRREMEHFFEVYGGHLDDRHSANPRLLTDYTSSNNSQIPFELAGELV